MKVQCGAPKRAANFRASAFAACVASILMLAHTVSYRALAMKLEAPVTSSPLDPNMTRAFPMQIGEWGGEELPIDEDIRKRTDAEGHINRRYVRRGGLETVSFYLACGVRARDLMPHRPEVCYVGNGWTRTGRHSLELPLGDNMTLPCNLIQFARGALSTEKSVVLHYYIVDGEYSPDVSLLRSRAWRGSGTVGYVAQVQIVSSVARTQRADDATRLVSDFATESAPSIRDLFASIENNHGDSSSEKVPEDRRQR